MKSSFVLIEVIISAIIASLVGIVLLQSHANNTNLLNYIFTKENIDKQSSFVLASLPKRESASDKNIYELLNEAGFLLDNDEIIGYFKDLKLDFKKSFFTQVDLQTGLIDDADIANGAKTKSIIVNQIDITIGGKQNQYFSIELQN